MARRRSTRGSITRRGNSWRIGFRAGTDSTTGEAIRVRETVRGSKVDAEQRLTQLLREHDVTGILPDREATVATFSKTWLDHVAHRVKPITLKRYRELLAGQVIPTIGPVRMTELRPAGVQATIDGVLARRSPRTAVNAYRVLSEMLAEGVRWGVIATNPAAAIRPPRAPRPKLHVPDQRHAPRSWNAFAAVRSRDRSCSRIGTGMRLGKIVGLQWPNVDLDRKVLRVASTPSVAGGEFTFGAPKTNRARRSVDLRTPSSRSCAGTARSRASASWPSETSGAITTSYSMTASASRCRRGRCPRTSVVWWPSSDSRGRASTTCDTRMPRACCPPACT